MLIRRNEISILKEKNIENELVEGFDKEGYKKYGRIEFDLSNLPDVDNTIISNSYIEIEVDKINALNNLRFHIEMVNPCDGERTHEKVQNRNIIERIGYDVSVEDIKKESKQRFVFDTHAINEMVDNIKETEGLSKAVFIISVSIRKISTNLPNMNRYDYKKTIRQYMAINLIIKWKKFHKHYQKL